MKKKVEITEGHFSREPRCPQCSAKLDGFTGLDGARPKEDDFTICAYCTTVLRFVDDEGNTRLASDSEIAEVKNEVPYFKAFLNAARERSKKAGHDPTS